MRGNIPTTIPCNFLDNISLTRMKVSLIFWRDFLRLWTHIFSPSKFPTFLFDWLNSKLNLFPFSTTAIVYRTRAIITRGLYLFYPIFHCGLYLRAVCTAERLVITWIFFHLRSPHSKLYHCKIFNIILQIIQWNLLGIFYWYDSWKGLISGNFFNKIFKWNIMNIPLLHL